MSHDPDQEQEQKRAGSSGTDAARARDTAEPGQSSRSARLHKPEQAIPSGLSQQKASGADATGADVYEDVSDATAAAFATAGGDLMHAGIVRSTEYKEALSKAATKVEAAFKKLRVLTERIALELAENASVERDAIRKSTQDKLGPLGKTVAKIIEKTPKGVTERATKYIEMGKAEALRQVALNANSSREAANRLATLGKVAGPALSAVGGGLAAYGLARDIERGDVASGVGNAASVTSSALTLSGAGVAAVSGTAGAGVATGLAAAGMLTGAFATGYAFGSLLNKLVVQDLVDKAAPGSGAVGDWYYRTFLR